MATSQQRLYELSSKLVDILAGAGFTIVAQQPLFVTIKDSAYMSFMTILRGMGFGQGFTKIIHP